MPLTVAATEVSPLVAAALDVYIWLVPTTWPFSAESVN